MAAVAVPFPPDKSTYRCVLTSSSTATDAHQRWLQEKELSERLKREKKLKAEEAEKREAARKQELKRKKEEKNQLEFKLWQEQKQKEELMKKKAEESMLSLIKKVDNKDTSEEGKQLYRNWIKLKTQQKEFEKREWEKKLKKEEQKKQVRKALAVISYEQWKENAKFRSIFIPKNGFQIFGPKPKVVVTDDWVSHEPMGSLEEASTRSLHAMENPKMYTINSFRSERMLEENSGSNPTGLTVDMSNWSLVPWSRRGGTVAATPSDRSIPLTRKGSSKPNILNKSDDKQSKKKRPPFR